MLTRRRFSAADPRQTWLWLIPVLLVAFLLGAVWLDRDSIWFDEYYSLVIAGLQSDDPVTIDPVMTWQRVAEDDPNYPPLYFLLLNAWAWLTSAETFTLRAFSLFVGLLTFAVTYRLGRDLVSPRVGLYGTIALGTSAFFIIYLHEMRMYTLIVFATTLTLWLYLTILTKRREPGPVTWFLFFAGCVAVLYSHYYAVAMLMAIALYHLLQKPRNRRWWAVWIVFLLASIAFLPWLHIFIDRIGSRPAITSDLDGVAQSFLSILSNGYPILLIPLLLMLLVTGRQQRRSVLILTYFAITSISIVVVANVFKPLMVVGRLRYLLFVWPLLCLLVSVAFANVDRWVRASRWSTRASLALALGWAALGIGTTASGALNPEIDGQFARMPMQHIERVFSNREHAYDALVFYLPDAISRGNQRQLIRFYDRHLPAQWTIAAISSELPTREIVDNTTWAAIGEGRLRFWVATRPDMDTGGLDEFQSQIAGRGYELCETTVNRADFQLQLFGLSPVCCFASPSAAATHRFGDGIEIVASEPLTDAASQTLSPGVVWRLAPSVPLDTYSVSYQVLDEERNRVAQVDLGLSSFRVSCSRPEIALSDVPDGTYSLWVAVYDWQTQARLPGQDLTNGGVSDLLELGTFQVRHDR